MFSDQSQQSIWYFCLQQYPQNSHFWTKNEWYKSKVLSSTELQILKCYKKLFDSALCNGVWETDSSSELGSDAVKV